jgi:preprotein translocase subunit SecE
VPLDMKGNGKDWCRMSNQLSDREPAIAKKEAVKMAATAKPPVATRKDGPIQRVSRYLHEVRVELRKTTWPSRQELISSTKVVLGTVITVGVYVALADWLLSLVTTPLFHLR